MMEEVRQAKSAAAGHQAQLEETERKAFHLERQLKERGAECRELASLRKELEDVRTLAQSQEQRMNQSHREAQQSQADLASLEAILALLHLREVEENIYIFIYTYTVTLSFSYVTWFCQFSHKVIVTSSVYLFAQIWFWSHNNSPKQVITDLA